MLIDLQQRLSSALAEQQGAQQSLAVLEQKLHTLEIEKRLAESTETRMTAEIAQVRSISGPLQKLVRDSCIQIQQQ